VVAFRRERDGCRRGGGYRSRVAPVCISLTRQCRAQHPAPCVIELQHPSATLPPLADGERSGRSHQVDLTALVAGADESPCG
jgi:hypothetical protein